ncbi:protein phosphatase, partial [Streptomyces racemochromogenes]
MEKNKTAIDTAAGTFRDAGSNVDSEFQGLSAFYSAPEAEKLFATTKPVKTDSDFFADQLESASKALGEYITEARPIVARLKELQAKATTFSNKISGDAHWKDDGDKIDENNDLIHDVNAAVSAFWAAERTCANKIRALYCAAPLVADDGSHGANMYGYKGEDLNKAQDLPWGSQLEETHRAWEIGYWVKSFVWDGLIVDGIWGTIRGLGTLVGVDGWDKAGQAWTGLAKLATGLAIASMPGVGTAFWLADDKDLPSWIRDSRTAVKETGKALVAWDEWGKNPARAAGAVTFNVLTTVFTGGAGTAAKAGTVAKVISVAGKAGRLIDPMTYIGKAGSLAKVKVGDLFANLGKVDGAFPKITDVVWKDLPKADMPGVRFPHPEDTVRLPDDALGRPQFYDKTTHQLLDHQGLPKQDLTSVPKGPDHPLAEVPKKQEVTVGGGDTHPVKVTADQPLATTADNAAHQADHTPGGTAGHTPHNSHTEPGNTGTTPGHGGTDTTPTTGG